MVGGDMADDREPEARTARLPAPSPIDAVEALEDALEVGPRDALSFVSDSDRHALATRIPTHGDEDPSRAIGERLESIPPSRPASKKQRSGNSGKSAVPPDVSFTRQQNPTP